MLNKNDVIARLDQLKEYCVTQKSIELNLKCEEDLKTSTDIEETKEFYKQAIKDCTDLYISLMQPLYTAVNSYFDGDRSAFTKPLNELAEWLHNELWQSLSKWEFAPPQTSSNPPSAYSDLRNLFYTFGWINTSNEEFYNAWNYYVPETTEEDTTTEEDIKVEPLPSSNSFIGKWEAEINNAYKVELQNIDSLGVYLYNSMGYNSSFMLWEDTGNLLFSPETKDLAKIIFVDRKLIEAVKTLNISIYIPTYLRGE